MKRLLHIEQIKILNYNPFRIAIALYFIFFSLGIVIYPLIDREIPVISISDVFRFPDVWMFMTWITDPFNVILALIIIMIVSKEFTNHTFKTQVIFGMSRTELLTQKLLTIFVLALFATLLVGATSLSLGLIYSYKLTFKIALENMWILGMYFLVAFSYMTFGLLFALLIRNTAMALLSFLALRTFIEPIIFIILKSKDMEFRWYLPLKTITRLTPIPDLVKIFERKMNTNGAESEPALNVFPDGLPLWLNVTMVFIYTGIIIYFCYRIIQRKRLT